MGPTASQILLEKSRKVRTLLKPTAHKLVCVQTCPSNSSAFQALQVSFNGGSSFRFSAELLRLESPAANAKAHLPGGALVRSRPP